MGFRAAATAQASQAKVENFDLILTSQKEIRRLDIAVNQAMLMSMPQSAGCLPNEITSTHGRQGAVIVDHLLQVLACNILHDQIAKDLADFIRVSELAGIKGKNDIRMA